MQDLLNHITPALIALIGAVLTYLLSRVAGAVQAATGIEIEKRHREALHSAIMTGIAAALAKGPAAGVDVLKAQAISYAQHSVPDAIRALVPGDGVLDALAERYVMEALERAGIKLPSGGVAGADAQRFLERGTS
ncbi:hypothetical protein [Salipiger marinus]|uniref:hypothetical protein n=1 Tax=Salipiger marinus TaxID=555512 RepID=UPI00405A29ED